jgi:hypothetical protein
MKRDKPILQILADETGVYEVGIRSLANDYGNAEHLSSAIKPAIAIIDRAIRHAYAEAKDSLTVAAEGPNSNGTPQ